MQNMTLLFSLLLVMDGVSGAETDETESVRDVDSVTLHTNLSSINNDDIIIWMFGPEDSVISQITRKANLTSIFFTDDMGFRGRLQVDQNTGSLTIRNTRIRHAGQYKLSISRKNYTTNIFSFTVFGASGVDADAVSVMEGDSVTLNTDLKADQHDRIRWYYNDIRMVLITGDQSKICTDVQCKERFRDRLKLDHQTGSLTITNITNTDSGVYEVQFNSGTIVKIFNVTVHAAKIDEVKTKSVKEGESVTLDPGKIKKTTHSIMWYFNEILIAEMTVDQSKICTDVQCKERFRDRLKLDHQTGSLAITNIRTSDSGEYKLQINSRIHRRRHRRSIGITTVKKFSVSVSAVPDSGPSSAAIAGICATVVLLVAATSGLIYFHKHQANRNRIRKKLSDQNGENKTLAPCTD